MLYYSKEREQPEWGLLFGAPLGYPDEWEFRPISTFHLKIMAFWWKHLPLACLIEGVEGEESGHATSAFFWVPSETVATLERSFKVVYVADVPAEYLATSGYQVAVERLGRLCREKRCSEGALAFRREEDGGGFVVQLHKWQL